MNPNFSQFTGIDWGISFDHISAEWDEQRCLEYCLNIKHKYAKQTKVWTDDLHSEWLTRNYLAVKMILSASVMLTTFEYCRANNVRIVQPYLLYYATLSCCRAVHFTLPDFKLQDTDLYAMTHKKIINVTSDHLEKNFPNSGPKSKSFLQQLRGDREMFSYKFPAKGFVRSDMSDHFDKVVDICSLLSENAEINSECLEASIRNNVVGNYTINEEIVKKCFLYESELEAFVDDDDYYRADYMARKITFPSSLSTIATEGLVEDYFGSWYPEDEDGDPYNPDANWRIIFPFN
jgi:hypothetical protein